MENEREQLPKELAALADEFEFAAAPFDLHRSDDRLSPGAAASLELAGFAVGLIGLLVSLIGVYQTGTDARRKRVPDFENLLKRLLSGELSPEQVEAKLAKWNPRLTPAEVGQLWRTGKIELYQQVLTELGYPPEVRAQILKDSFGAIAELAIPS